MNLHDRALAMVALCTRDGTDRVECVRRVLTVLESMPRINSAVRGAGIGGVMPLASPVNAVPTDKKATFRRLVKQHPAMTERELAQRVGIAPATAHRWKVAIK